MFRLCMTPVTKNNLWQKVACDWSHFSLCEWSYSSTFLCRSSSACAVEGYPYVGLVALTFLTEPTVDFSITPDNILGGAVSVAWQHWILPLCCMQFFCYGYRTSSLHPSIWHLPRLCLFTWSVDSWPSIIFAKFGWWWLSGEDHIAMMLPARNGRGCFAQPAHICVFVCLSNRSWFMILVNTWHLGYSPCPHLFPGMEVWRKYIAWTNDPRLMAGQRRLASLKSNSFIATF